MAAERSTLYKPVGLSDAVPLVDRLLEAVRWKIENTILRSGDRLPSIRRFAETMSVSPSTVVEVYDRLVAEGLVKARRGSGFYVCDRSRNPLMLSSTQESPDREVDPFWVSRQSLDAASSAIKPGCGWLPASWMPEKALRTGVRAASQSDAATLTDYGTTRGSSTLRRLILGRLAEEGLETTSDNIVLTSSGTQAVDLLCRYLLRPGDAVIVDDPCYFNFHALLRAHQARIIGIPFTTAGPDVSAFEAAVCAERPRIYITNTGIHNPTGVCLSANVAHKLLSLATAHGVTVIEDDIFTDYSGPNAPRLAVLDGLQSVVRIGSFSKTLSASMRCGYVVATSGCINDLINLQVASSFTGPSPIICEVLSYILSSGHYRKHLSSLRLRLARARNEVIERLSQLDIHPWVTPRDGPYLWCRLPGLADSARLAKECIKDNVILAPGNVFSISQSAAAFLRFNVAQSLDPRMYSSLRRALNAQSLVPP